MQLFGDFEIKKREGERERGREGREGRENCVNNKYKIHHQVL